MFWLNAAERVLLTRDAHPAICNEPFFISQFFARMRVSGSRVFGPCFSFSNHTIPWAEMEWATFLTNLYQAQARLSTVLLMRSSGSTVTREKHCGCTECFSDLQYCTGPAQNFGSAVNPHQRRLTLAELQRDGCNQQVPTGVSSWV